MQTDAFGDLKMEMECRHGRWIAMVEREDYNGTQRWNRQKGLGDVTQIGKTDEKGTQKMKTE